MVQINFALKEVNCKIVYYGCGLSGKTTNLEVVHSKAPKEHVGELTSIATEGDRTLFFDFLPLHLGQVAGMNTKFQIYTVPGQVYYNSTRKLVLQGADGIVFVADSRRGKMDENIESLQNLEENLLEYGMDIRTTPWVIQYNKRDLDDIYSVEDLNAKINPAGVPHFEAVAVTGEGVFPTLKKVSSMVLESLNRQQGSTSIKVPKGQKASAKQAKQAVAVGAGPSRGSAAGSSRVSKGAGRRPQGKSGAPQRKGAKTARPGSRGSQVVRDRVARSPDVKPIERRRPPGPAARRPSARRRAAAPPKPKSKAGLLVTILLLALIGVGVAAYFTGMLDSFLN